MTEFQISETVEELEAQHAVLRGRITRAVGQASDGQSDGADIPKLTREAAALGDRIAAAKAERDRAQREQRRLKQEQARADLPKVRAECLVQRDAFLASYRAACIALGSYLDLLGEAGRLTSLLATAAFGVLPEDMNALRALEFTEPPAETVRAGLTPKIGADWRLSFPITPMHEQFKTR